MHTPHCHVLTVENLTLDLGGRRILRDVSLVVEPGQFLGVIGPNGGGKTSLLRVLLGILPPTSGRIDWSEATCGRPRIGYVPQRVSVESDFPLNAIEVLRQGFEGARPLFGSKRRDVFTRGDRLQEEVGLPDQGAIPFVHLSGGQQRRLLLARALMNSPSVLLLDEPTAGVDAEGQEQFCEILDRLSREGITIILVSHDVPLIMGHASRIACLSVGLHWHGPAGELDQGTVREAYRCELDRYRVLHGDHEDIAGHHNHPA